MGLDAYWIDPRGKLIQVKINHINTVIQNPKAFGLTKDKIQAVYDKYNEKITWEGKAREEIMIDLMKKGFIRIRERSNGWTIQLWKLVRKMNDYLWEWAVKISPKAYDKLADVNIWEVAKMGSKPKVSISLKDLASGKSVKEGAENLQWIDDVTELPELTESDWINWDTEEKLDKYLRTNEEKQKEEGA